MDFGKLKGVLVEGKEKFQFVKPEKGAVVLSESDTSGEMEVRLTNAPNNALAIHAPKNQWAYLGRGYAKSCDYFIIIPSDGITNVVLCEMKTTLRDSELAEACKQIKCSVPLFWYIKAVLTEHFGEGKDEEVRMHYTIIAKREKRKVAYKNVPHRGGGGTPYYYENRKFGIIVSRDTIPIKSLLRSQLQQY